MTTATPIRRSDATPLVEPTPSYERQAMRFLLGHRLGRLMTIDPASGEPLVAGVHYVLDTDGALVTHLPADSEQVAAIGRGGASVLSVYARHAYVPSELRDADGLPTPQAVRQVQVNVSARVIEGSDAVARVLHRQIAGVLETIGQATEADEISRARRSELEGLVVVRLAIESMKVRLYPDALATNAD